MSNIGKFSPWFIVGAMAFAALFMGLPQMFGKETSGEWQAIYIACALSLFGLAFFCAKSVWLRAVGPLMVGLGLITLLVGIVLLFSG